MASTARLRSLVGVKIGNYELRDKLGEGGMGAVYLAEHATIAKRVAIKVLHPELAAREDAAARWQLEARAVNEVHHANVVDIIDCGVTDVPGHGAVHYMLMELLEGESLRARLRRGALSPADAIAIVREVAVALAAAHAKNIIHRDVKPENIFLVAGDELNVKVLDFGIAKLTDGHPFSERLTQSGVALGTPQYMAPEQLDAEDIDGRADVYALGIMLYEMVCGAAPFAEETTARGVWRRMNELPVIRDEIAETLPAGLEALILATIDPSRARRPTMAALVTALEHPQHELAAHEDASPQTRRLSSKPRHGSEPSASSQRAAATTRKTAPPIADDKPTRSEPNRRTMWIVLGAVSVAAIVVAVVLATRNDEPSRHDVAAAPPIDAPAVVPIDVAAVAIAVDAGVEVVDIEIVSTPSAADVFVGAERTARGRTPLTLHLPKAEGTIELRLQLAGFLDLKRPVSTQRDARLELPLRKRTGSQQGPTGNNLLQPH